MAPVTCLVRVHPARQGRYLFIWADQDIDEFSPISPDVMELLDTNICCLINVYK